MRVTLVVVILLLAAAARPNSALGSGATRDCCVARDEVPQHDSHPGLESDFRVMIGFRNGLTLPGGGAERIWDRAGEFGVADGLRLGLGYDHKTVGIMFLGESGFSGLKPSDALIGLQSSHVTAAVLLHWRPDADLGYGFRPRLGVGYVRERIGTAHFGGGEFPVDALDPAASSSPEAAILHYPGYVITHVRTEGDGIRLSAGADRRVWGNHLDIFAEAAFDLVSFGRVHMMEAGDLPLAGGWSRIPALSVGIAWRPF